MSFGGDLASFARKTGITMDRIMRKICLDLIKDLVLLTPVDSGLARSNYFFGTDRAGGLENAKDRSGSASFARASQFAGTLQAGGVFYIVNNLPYIMALEFGHSGQAPNGMARIAVARAQAVIDRMGEVA